MLPMRQLGGRHLAATQLLNAAKSIIVNTLLASVVLNTQLTTQFFPTIEEVRTWAAAFFYSRCR